MAGNPLIPDDLEQASKELRLLILKAEELTAAAERFIRNSETTRLKADKLLDELTDLLKRIKGNGN